MWGNKKSHTPQAADPEPKNWQTNQPPKRTPASNHCAGSISQRKTGNRDQSRFPPSRTRSCRKCRGFHNRCSTLTAAGLSASLSNKPCLW